MTEKKFWKIIDKSRSRVNKNSEQHQARLIRRLAKRSVGDIMMFDTIFTHYMNMANTWELKAASHIMNPKGGEVFFADFRGWLISQGRKKYYKALKNPESLTKIISRRDPMDWVGYGACALEAYELKTGKELPPPHSIKGIKWEEDDLPAKFPRLWQRFGG
ncbi:MAG: DUF4240 domain-containing protein [Bacteroidota bacterium]